MDRNALLQFTSEIVASHASQTEMTQEQLLSEIQNVFAKLAELTGDSNSIATESPSVETPSKPAVPLEAAFGVDKVFCMICGAGMKTLKRHLNSAHGMNPGQYRKQFGIPVGTPLVSVEYSKRRKSLAANSDLAARFEKARATRGKSKVSTAKPRAASTSPGKGKRGRPAKAASSKKK